MQKINLCLGVTSCPRKLNYPSSKTSFSAEAFLHLVWSELKAPYQFRDEKLHIISLQGVVPQSLGQMYSFSFILGFSKINWGGVLSAVTSLPSAVFFVAWIVLMGFMGWYRKNRFRNDDAGSNWTAQIVNAIGQTCLLLGILFA